MQDIEERIAGVLLGLAAGDRIGGPARMALRVAESLRDLSRFDADDIGIRYLDWWRAGAFDTGPTTERVLSLVDRGFSFEEAAMIVDREAGGRTAGCNPAHRSAPLAMSSTIKDAELAGAAVAEAQLTHRHALAGDVAAAVVNLCRTLIRGVSWPLAVKAAAVGRLSETRRALEIAPPDRLSRSGFSPDVLSASIHFVSTSDSFRTALLRSIEFAGPTNYCPVIVGSIGGARWGCTAVENGLIFHHGDLVIRLQRVAFDLARQWQKAELTPGEDERDERGEGRNVLP